ncbi:MAG TPA: Crp/Fnr family transcriptional regulator [Firmicutes bacterium]|nr:Crp/Fnr family transcriptional regulator [Bacillota bacterium]
MEKKKLILELRFFQGIRSETAERLSGKALLRKYERGALIYRAKERIGRVCFQMEGKSILYNMTHSGSRKIIFILGKGELLNDHVLNDHETSVFCEAIETSLVLEFPAALFAEEMERDFGLVRQVIAAQERKIWRLGHQLKNTMGSIYLERKLAAKLWKLARDFGIRTAEGIEIDISMPVTFLADLLGTPRETASRLCKTLTENGLIIMKKKKIIIPDPERMSRFYKTGQP